MAFVALPIVGTIDGQEHEDGPLIFGLIRAVPVALAAALAAWALTSGAGAVGKALLAKRGTCSLMTQMPLTQS